MENSWLAPEVISTLANTVTTAVLAGVALIFSFRQNVGWKPIIFAHGATLKGQGGSQRHVFGLTAEFWNRRKYPVVVRAYRAKVEGVEILSYPAGAGKPYVRNGVIYYSAETILNPQEKGEFSIEVEFENQSLDAMRPEFELTFSYFDPYRNRSSDLQARHRFFYPELGWNKTGAQREAARNAYAELHPPASRPA